MPQWVWIGAAMLVGLVPALAVAWYLPRLRVSSAWWWMAAAFGVSFVADVATVVVPHPMISQAYPLLQAGLFALVLAARPVAIIVIGVLAVVSGISLGWRGAAGLDVLLHLAAWGSTAALAHVALTSGPLRTTLVWGFGLLALAWCWFRWEPTFLTWGVMQGVRLAMAVGFWWAVSDSTRETHDEA